MLTNLDWLSDGSEYPPACEKNRINLYKTNERLFLSEHASVWENHYREIARRLKKKDNCIETVLNYQQLLSKKTADFVCGETPTIETEGDTDALKKMLEHKGFRAKLYESIIDVSRFGNAVLKLVGNRITTVSPYYWFPVVDPSDLKEIIQHVIAYPINPGKDGKPTELYAEIHNKGSVEQRKYSYDSQTNKIGKIKDAKITNTGFDDFAVHPLTNVTHSGSIYGLDDYVIINSIVQTIMWRLYCIDSVLDKHSEPSVSGPASALSFDERTGMYYLNLANYFTRDNKDDPDVSYITWDGNLESSFKEIETLIDQLYTLSEMGQAFMEGGGDGQASSGTALKLRMVSPRMKAARLVGINEPAVKRIICLLAQINSINVDYDELTMHWNDGLPVDEVEQADTLTTATGGKAIMSQYSALKRMGLSDTEVEAELEQMQIEQASAAPTVLTTIDLNSTEPTEDGD